ncbi:hypothetical protein A2164_00925 [Candidatus Curtissbacteria bacterium RBG_13_35_7]|uniref:Acyl carrier protein n=1 Tax=Candidatus Curtissbacteria bacterium RBG_13_35_7 TaxID=1797705 RepID=A0A1F5G1Q2_9BACT|nr:MAG: hypothetical protein A2164_00925 [Candidatus Curtissbacteria bacterium RBG_13_35_7]
MTDIEIFENIKKIINKQFGIDEEKIEEDSYLDEDLNITDLEIEDLISNIAEKFNLVIPEEKIIAFKKISDLISYIYENADTTN